MSIMSRPLIALIRWYQRFISPRIAPRCRYYPSCSSYGLHSIEVHGPLKGTLLMFWRILRCNPWSHGGVDYVPQRGAWPTKPLGHEALLALWREEDATTSVASGDTSHGKDDVPPPVQQNSDLLRSQQDSDARKD